MRRRARIRDLLEPLGIGAERFLSAEELLRSDFADGWGRVMMDTKSSGLSGFDASAQIQGKGIGTPMVMTSAGAAVDAAVRALRQGAVDFFLNPFGN